VSLTDDHPVFGHKCMCMVWLVSRSAYYRPGPHGPGGSAIKFFFFMSDRGGGTDRLTITATMTTTTSPTHQTYPMRDASASEYDISTFVKKR